MKRTKRIAAGVASLAMVASMAVAMPLGASAATEYTTNSDGTAVLVGGSDAWLTNTVTDKDSATYTSRNATEFKKVLEIEDTANIPSVSFDYAVTSGPTIPATYDSTTKAVETLAVFAGIDPTLITYKYENVEDSATVFDTASNTDYVTTPTAETGKQFKITYAPQNVVLPSSGSTKKADHDDNVLLNNVSGDTYYAIKTVQMDFSKVKFTEPGIYRYYIEETGDNQGVTNDYENQVSGADVANVTRWRTLDVYVEDATYVTNDGTNDTTNYKLRIAGYVMYVGKQTVGPAAGNATIDSPSADIMEDGLTHTNPSGNGGANGVEVASAEKSEGIKNIYATSDITFKKTVTGNQASKDKFFKFTIQLTTGTTSNVADTDVFVVSADSTQQVIAAYNGENTAPNSATPYSKDTIYDANNASLDSVNSTVRYVTGAQLIAGYDFYLQDGQQVTIQGIPNGVGYVLKEYQDDYTPTVALKSEAGYDNLAGGATGTAITAPVIANVSNIAGELTAPENTATITDETILGNVEATFTNNREGTIPTGILLSVAAPAGVGVVVIGGIAYLLIKNKRREAEEE